MKKRPARALLNATVLVVSANGKEGILVKPLKRGGSWELPGGKIDERESLPSGACREVFEETGIRVQLEALVSLYKCARQDGLMFLFIGRYLEGDLRPRPKEIADARWEPLDTMFKSVHCSLNRQRVQDCLNFNGSPVYRLIRKRPFEVVESWDLGPSSLEGFDFLQSATSGKPEPPAPPEPVRPARPALRWWGRPLAIRDTASAERHSRSQA